MTRPPARMSAVMWRCRSAKPWTPSRPAALASAGVCAAIASATSAPVPSLLTWRRILLCGSEAEEPSRTFLHDRPRDSPSMRASSGARLHDTAREREHLALRMRDVGHTPHLAALVG